MNMMAFRLTLGALTGAFLEPVDPQEVKKVVGIFNIFQVISPREDKLSYKLWFWTNSEPIILLYKKCILIYIFFLISEREPDDWEQDPSLHPTRETLFMEKTKKSIQSKFLSHQISKESGFYKYQACKLLSTPLSSVKFSKYR